VSYATSGVLRAVSGRPPFLQGSNYEAAGLIALGACSQSATENKADNIEENTEAVADNFDAMAANATTEAGESNLENAAEATRNEGANAAEAVRNSGE
jgi:hypothetical protein